jgi:hypothetical protein
MISGFQVMRTTLAVLAAAFALMTQVAADAAEYQYFSGQTPNWRTNLVKWLNEQKPTPENVTAGIGENFGVHVYIVPGQFTGTYSLQHGKHPANKPSGIIRAVVDGGTGKLLGFNGSDVFVLTWTKAQQPSDPPASR